MAQFFAAIIFFVAAAFAYGVDSGWALPLNLVAVVFLLYTVKRGLEAMNSGRKKAQRWIKSAGGHQKFEEDVELLAEEKLYEYVGSEIESNNIRPGIWTKAVAASNSSNSEVITREYIRIRISMLKAEGRLWEEFLEDAEYQLENQ